METYYKYNAKWRHVLTRIQNGGMFKKNVKWRHVLNRINNGDMFLIRMQNGGMY